MTKISPDIPVLEGGRTAPMPRWALLQRQVFSTLDQASIEFADRYTRPDGTLIWRDNWPGMDGSDDPYEGFMYMPLLYALGGSEEVYRRAQVIYDGITWQWTEYGQIHREFDAYYDWMHHGESSLFLYFLGLASPAGLKDRQRTKRFAGFYNGEDPDVQNYDAQLRLMRAPISGSRGPRFSHSGEDWSTHREILDRFPPPFEDLPGIDPYGRVCPWSDDATYELILKQMNERQAKGDVPLNLGATSLMAHAFMYDGDDRHRQWTVDYLDAWVERTEQNGGITPDNIGLSGQIGEYNDGKWWGGYYGWRWPHGAFSILDPITIAGLNGLLMTGDERHLDLARSQLDMLWSLRRDEDGQAVVPNRHFDEGWRDYRVVHPVYAVTLWNASMSDDDAERAERAWPNGQFEAIDTRYAGYGKTIGGHMAFNGNTAQWFRFMRGGDAAYPETLLASNLETIVQQIERFRSDAFDPLTMDHEAHPMGIHMWQQISPMVMEGLIQLTTGGPAHMGRGGLQLSRFRYFDAQKQRPGLPQDVAALVDHLEADAAGMTLVNTSATTARELIVQAGAFGEHSFTTVAVDGEAEQSISGRWVTVKLAPGAVTRLEFGMQRYANKPSYDTPWVRALDAVPAIKGREL